MNEREALKLALEALEQLTKVMLKTRDELAERGGRPVTNKYHQMLWDASFAVYTDHAIPTSIAIREALAQPEEEPVAWEGGEGWESLAWELCADENGEEACNELIWEGGPIPEPWGDRWMKYEDEAKRLIALVQKHTAPPQRKPLTDEELQAIADKCRLYPRDFARAIEQAHGIKEG